MRKHLFILIIIALLAAACSGANTPEPQIEVIKVEVTATPAPQPTATNTLPAATPTTNDAPVSDSLTIDAPKGAPPILDGVLSPDEWSGAQKTQLIGDGELLYMRSDGYLYLGIRAQDNLVGSVCIDQGNEVAILHSSAALGTARYKKADEGWRLAQGFSWSNRDTSNSEQAQRQRDMHLKKNNWLASITPMGTPEEMEYQIAMPEGSVRLAVAYIQAPNYRPTAWLPPDLDDDCRNITLIQGDTPATLQFSPDQWATFTISSSATDDSTAAPTPTPLIEVESEKVTLTTEDGVELAGTLYLGQGDTAVVLAHMGISDQTNWQPFAELIAQKGFTALTFDFRCYGQSDCNGGGQNNLHIVDDLRAAIALLHDRGFNRIACMGASMGGSACMNAGLNEEFVGLVVIGSPVPPSIGMQHYPEDLLNPSMPKLFVTTEDDRFSAVRSSMPLLYKKSPEPKEFKTFPGSLHGTELFYSSQYRDEFTNLLLDFLTDLPPVDTSKTASAPSPTPTATPLPTVAPTATPPPAPTVQFSTETVSFTTEDDIELAGTLFLSEGEGDTAVVLAHMAGENDQESWKPFAKKIARRGITALTFDFRCYGQSDCRGSGESGAILLSRDLGAAIGFLREQGFQRIVCIGASMGGRGCVNVAFDEELAGLVIVAGTGSSHPDRQNLEDFVSPDMPKLFIVSENDHIAERTPAMTRLYESAPEPKIFKTFSGAAHGTELFDSKHGKALRTTILNFLEDIRSSTPGATRTRLIDGMIMSYIPTSEFEMGSSDTEIDAAFEQCEQDRGSGQCERAWFEDESPRHSVTLDAFWIDQTEVSNAQFAIFLNERGNQSEGDASWLELEDKDCQIEQVDGNFQPKAGYAEHPVIEVTWYGAKAYCAWAGGSLPTEEKWEYAARGIERHVYPWGGETPTCELANYAGCQESTMPVGSLPKGDSWCGAKDMAGNVWEWVANWYLPYPGSQHDNEDFGQTFKVIRGGGWNLEPYYLRAAQRNLEYMPHISLEHTGFRCVVPVDK